MCKRKMDTEISSHEVHCNSTMVTPRAFPSWVCLKVTSFNAQLMHFFRIFLYPLDISPEVLKKSTSYFGYNPLRCFISASSVKKLEEMKEVIKLQITDIASCGKVEVRS